jgi:hypothetical protein
VKNKLIDASSLALDFIVDDAPDADSLREMVLSVGIIDFNDQPEGLLGALVAAYFAQAEHEALDAGSDDDMDLVSRGDAETLFREYSILGYRSVLKMKDASDSDVYECCDWASNSDIFSKILWPRRLLAELAYIKGRRAARQAIALRDYYRRESVI